MTFLFGCLVTTLENRVVGAIDRFIDGDSKTKKEEPNKAPEPTP
jgi:hypothetical protein